MDKRIHAEFADGSPDCRVLCMLSLMAVLVAGRGQH